MVPVVHRTIMTILLTVTHSEPQYSQVSIAMLARCVLQVCETQCVYVILIHLLNTTALPKSSFQSSSLVLYFFTNASALIGGGLRRTGFLGVTLGVTLAIERIARSVCLSMYMVLTC
jgi:hypothetical protein